MTVPAQDYLRTLDAIRDRCYQVYAKAQAGELDYFDVDESRLEAAVDHVVDLTRRRFKDDLDSIPPHSRLRHFIDDSFETWRQKQEEPMEATRKLIDLVIVSVLVDAGAGQRWRYKTKQGKMIGRSEGLAVASVDMFLSGYFSSSTEILDRVDAQGLENVTLERMTEGFQATHANPMVGLDGRSALLNRLAGVLKRNTEYFGHAGRPGNMLDYLLQHKSNDNEVSIDKLWKVVMSLGDIWPARIEIDGVKLGDVWPCTCLEKNKKSEYDHLVPFHKLSQWLTYSLVEVIETSGLGLKVQGVEKLTGLPEYRNGGLLIDHGVLTLKPEQVKRCGGSDTSLPCFEGNDPLVVEWRALTVVYLDKIHKECEKKLGRPLKLAQVLESGTWTAGREIASKLRPETGGPPISIKSDGTIF